MKSLSIMAFVVVALSASTFAGTVTLTFSEFPVGTVVTSQYAADGVVFSGVTLGPPVIADDAAMPDSPVLSPDPPYAGDFQWTFPSGATGVQFDSGFWDTLGTGIINVYDQSGVLLGTFTNTTLAVDHFDFTALGTIGRVTFNSYADPAGADVDNLTFTSTPEPSSLLLIASGLFGVVGYSRKLLR